MPFKNRLQVALEFLMIYLIILVIFMLVFMTVIMQRSSLVSNQASLSLQLIVQNIASEIGTVGTSGNGFSLVLSLVPTIDNVKYSILMSNTGMVIGSMKIGNQNITAEAIANYQSIHINGTEVKSQNNIRLYSVPLINGTDLYFYNSNDSIYINERPMNYSPQGIVSLKQAAAVKAATFNASGIKPSIIFNNYIAPISNNFASHTISAWIYLNSYSSAPQAIYSEGTPSETLVWQILPNASLQLGIYNGAQWNFVNSSAPIPLHQWVFVSGVITKVPGSTTYLVPIEYINGTVAGVESKNLETFGTNPSAHYFAIGGYVSAPFNDFNGSIA
ncbi:MAG: LamG domain-containing protein, partial [Candidatus Marsarchaeota archaeon]|nr:LamG domain-containing protein [Candidatus Marsarchaeota archaeon]